MLQLFALVVLSWLALYWLPTVAAVLVVGVLFALFTGTLLSRAVKRGRRILAERRRAEAAALAAGEAPPLPRGKYDNMLSLLYWRESVVHAAMLGVLAGSAWGAEGGGLFGLGGGEGGGMGGADVGGFGDMGGGGDMGGSSF